MSALPSAASDPQSVPSAAEPIRYFTLAAESVSGAEAGPPTGRLGEDPAGSPFLVIRRGPRAGTRFALGGEATAIGRHPDCDIALADTTVSRRHAEIRRGRDGFVLLDTGHINPLQGIFDIFTWITAIVGSVVLLLIYYALIGGIGRRPLWRARR